MIAEPTQTNDPADGVEPSPATDREIVLTRVFDAPRARVFDAWTDPQQLPRWWGPRGFTATTHVIDVRPGGVWRFILHGPDGTDYDNRIVYTEITAPDRLAYVHGSDVDEDPARFHVVVTFEDEAGKTRLTMRMRFATAAQRDETVAFGAVELGYQTLDRLGEAVEAPPAPQDAAGPVEVRVVRRFDAPAAWVYDAWLDPALVGRWMFGPALRDEEVLRLQVDARVGGRFSFLVRRGGEEVDHVGTYRVLDRPRRLVFTWGIAGTSADESIDTVELEDRDGGCVLTLTHVLDPAWAAFAARTEAAWRQMLDVLLRLRHP